MTWDNLDAGGTCINHKSLKHHPANKPNKKFQKHTKYKNTNNKEITNLTKNFTRTSLSPSSSISSDSSQDQRLSKSSISENISCDDSSEDEISQNNLFENELFFRRLFKNIHTNYNQDHQQNNCATSINNINNIHDILKNPKNKQIFKSKTKQINNSQWQTFKISNILIVELGHTSLNAMSRNDIVDLIDTTIENKSIQKLIFYYNNQRTDVKNLDSVFKLMDFEMLGYLALNNVTSNAIYNSTNNNTNALEKFKFIFNNFNNYWIYDTQDFDVSSEDIFTEDEEEFI